jgi:hypothetical protein
MPQVTVQRVRRVRISGQIKVQPKSVREDDAAKMRQLLKSIANRNATIRQQAELAADEQKQLLFLMKTYRIPLYTHGDDVAEIKIPTGRATNTIDPKLYWDRVDEEAFFDSVRVSNEKAKKHLSGKELDEITDTTPGKKGEETLEIRKKD